MDISNIIYLNNIISDNIVLTFQYPLILIIKKSDDSSYYYVENDKIGLFIIAESYDEIHSEIFETIKFLWKEYVESVEELLSDEAEIIRNNLKNLIIKTNLEKNMYD